MDPNTKNTALGAAGAGASEGLGVEDVFSTWLYAGTSASQTITNGIDLNGEGGLVWIKNRDNANDHLLFDSERTLGYKLSSNFTDSEADFSVNFTSFNSDGFTIAGNGTSINNSSYDYASWTFRKAPGFFDVVTYTGNGSNRTISHNLGSVPGTIIVKRTNATSSWYVYHRSLGATKYIYLNQSFAASTGTIYWNDTAPTSSVFSVGTSSGVNGSGSSYVAYLFAHDEAVFGEGSDQSVIKCDSYTGSGSQGKYVEVGFEPQWLMIKRTAGTGAWKMLDVMRGMPVGSQARHLSANEYDAEFSDDPIEPGPTGFTLKSTGTALNTSGETYIYIAIRRGPMKTPTDATTVFNTVASTAGPPWWKPGFPVDWGIGFSKTTTDKFFTGTRLLGTENVKTNAAAAGSTNNANTFDYQNGWYGNTTAVPDYMSWNFRRAPGFFDVVAYTGNGTSQNVNHNLGVEPELIFVKNRSSASYDWRVYVESLGNTGGLVLNANSANNAGSSGLWNSTSPTSSVFTVGSYAGTNGSGNNFIAYLFASCPGVSKVGSYTGSTNVARDIDCGFAGGARFVLIKRTDTQINGTSNDTDWYVWDSTRGIVSGNDPYLLLNLTDAEVTNTDYIDPYTSGFTVTSSAPAALNASGGNYIFLAIA